MRKVFLAIAIIIFIAFIGGALYWYFVLSKEPTSTGTPSPTPTPAKNGATTLGELVLCKDFQKVENEISCEEAMRIATAKYIGRVKSIAPVRASLQKDPLTSKGVDMWRIDILLDNPLKKDQEIFKGARIFIDRKTGSEIRSRYLKEL